MQRITDENLFLVSTRKNPFDGYGNTIFDTLQLQNFSKNGTYKTGYWFPREKLRKALEENEGKDNWEKKNYQEWPPESNLPVYFLKEVIRLRGMEDTLLLAK